MAEYIDRDAAVKAFNNFDAGRADNPPFTLLTPEEFAEYLYELPTADVAPVVHGRWKASSVLLECQNCGEIYSRLGGNGGKAWNYCPNCGARMDYKE